MSWKLHQAHNTMASHCQRVLYCVSSKLKERNIEGTFKHPIRQHPWDQKRHPFTKGVYLWKFKMVVFVCGWDQDCVHFWNSVSRGSTAIIHYLLLFKEIFQNVFKQQDAHASASMSLHWRSLITYIYSSEPVLRFCRLFLGERRGELLPATTTEKVNFCKSNSI